MLLSLDIETNSPDWTTAVPVMIGYNIRHPQTLESHHSWFDLIRWPTPPVFEQWSHDNLPAIALENRGIGIDYSLAKLYKFLVYYQEAHDICGPDDKVTLLGHNILAFDIPCLRRFARAEQWDKVFHYRARDTAVVCGTLSDAGVLEYGKLGDYLSQFGIVNEQPHHAEADAKAEGDLYAAVVEMLRRNAEEAWQYRDLCK